MPTNVQLVCADNKLSWLQGHEFSNTWISLKRTHSWPCATDATCPCWSACPTITPLQAFRLDGDDADVCHQLGLMLWQTETTLKTYEARIQEARPMCSMFMHVFFQKMYCSSWIIGILQVGSRFSLVKSFFYNEQGLWLLSPGWLKFILGNGKKVCSCFGGLPVNLHCSGRCQRAYQKEDEEKHPQRKGLRQRCLAQLQALRRVKEWNPKDELLHSSIAATTRSLDVYCVSLFYFRGYGPNFDMLPC